MIHVAIISGFIPLLILLWRRNYCSAEVKAFLPYIILMAASTAYEQIFTTWLLVSSKYFFRIYGLLEYLAISYLFFKILPFKYWGFLKVAGIGFMFLFSVLIYQWEKINHLQGDSYLAVYQTLMLIVCSVLWFKEIFTNLKYQSLLHSPAFIFMAALMVYYSGCIFVFLLAREFSEQHKIMELWEINIYFNIILRGLTSFGAWIGTRKYQPFYG